MLRSIGAFFGLSENELRDLSAGGLVVTLLLLPFRICWGFIVFMVFAWTSSRSGRAFLFAVPAMIFAVLYVAVVWAVGFRGDLKAYGLAAARYAKASNPEEETYNPDAALLYAKKMVAADPELSEFSKYELGISYDRLEKFDEAFDVMSWIARDVELDASPSEIGFSAAYYWLAGYFADETKSPQLSEEERKVKSRKQMELAYKADPEYVFAVLGLAGMNKDDADALKKEAESLRAEGKEEEADRKLVEAEQKLDDAVKFLDKSIALDLVTERQLYASNVLIDIMQERGRDREAVLKGKQFIARYISLAERYPDVLPFWISIVKVCIQIGDFERGNDFILRGYQLAQDRQARSTLAKLAAQIEVEKSKTFEDMEVEEQFLGRLYALCKAIKTDIQVPEGYNEVMYYVDGFEIDDDKDYWLRDSLLSAATQDENGDPRLPGVIHIILGLRDILNEEEKAGIRHWEIATQQFAFTPYVINTMIGFYVEEREASDELRDRLLEIAIKLFPQEPVFYASRGKFYRDDEKFDKAIEDLEFAKSRLPDSILLLKNLEFCYQEIGNTEKAAEARKKIEEIESREVIDSIIPSYSSPSLDGSGDDEDDE